jgi:hypothetical protein
MERPLKVTRAWASDNWRLALVVLAGVGAVGLLLLFKLGSLVHGLSGSEFDLQQSISHDTITPELLIRNAVYLPYYLGLYVMQLSPFHGPSAVRFVGAMFGLMGAIGFFHILRKWYTLRMAIFGTALFATSSWFLHAARFASPESSYLLLPLLIAGVVYIQAKARARLVLLLMTILGLLCLYIPGMIWFLLPAVILERRIIIRSFRLQPLWSKIVLVMVVLLLLTPLVATIAWPYEAGNNALLALIGLPEQFPNIAHIAKNIGHLVSNVFAYNNQGPLYVPGHLPLLDASTAGLALIGIYRFVTHFRLGRTKLISLIGVFGTFLIATGGPVSLVLLLPFIYLLAVEGMKWLLDLWLTVFPRNPFARGFGVGIIIILVLATSIYHLNRYYLAWGHAPETRAVFNKLP